VTGRQGLLRPFPFSSLLSFESGFLGLLGVVREDTCKFWYLSGLVKGKGMVEGQRNELHYGATGLHAVKAAIPPCDSEARLQYLQF
jgi:hypothetical protein